MYNGDFYGYHLPENERHGGGPIHAIISYFRNYFNFSGKSNRPEFWWIQLFAILINILCVMYVRPSTLPSLAKIFWIVNLVLFIPNLSLLCRRIHDSGHSAKILAVAVIGYIIGFVVLKLTVFAGLIGIITSGNLHAVGYLMLLAILGVLLLVLFELVMMITIFVFTVEPTDYDI